MSKTHYLRNLPHWQPPESTFFITYRLAGSIPASVIRQLHAENLEAEKLIRENGNEDQSVLKSQIYDNQKRHFGRFDDYLDKNQNEPYWLRQPEIAKITANSIHFFENKYFLLWNFCIMPNHVHLMLTTLPDSPLLFKILQRIKSFSGRESNKILGKTGEFWSKESYDHLVRDRDEFARIERYIIQNPVKANLVDSWEDWPFSYIRPE
jgi:putative transposase